jgi:hypothetical protein
VRLLLLALLAVAVWHAFGLLGVVLLVVWCALAFSVGVQ